jgi:hypothetical protein
MGMRAEISLKQAMPGQAASMRSIPVTRKMKPAESSGGAYEWETGNAIIELFSTLRLDPAD